MRVATYIRTFTSLALLLVSLSSQAAPAPTYAYPFDSGHLLIRYSLWDDSVADSGQPFIEIYGDGTLIVRPRFGKPDQTVLQARLSPEELETLLSFLDEKNVLSLDENRYKALQERAEASLDGRGMPWASSYTTAVFEIHLDDYKEFGALQQELVLPRLGHYARSFPEAREINALQEASRHLYRLSRRTDLAPLPEEITRE